MTAPVLVVCSPGGGLSGDSFAVPRQGGSLVDGLGATCAVASVGLLGATMRAAGDALADAAAGLRSGSGARAVVGLGHSLGAAVTIDAQARHRAFDAVVSIGYSPATAALLAGDPPPEDHADMLDRLRRRDPGRWDSDSVLFPHDPQDRTMWGDDPDESAAEQLRADHPPVPRALAVDFCLPEPAQAAAASVVVPVLLAFGEREVDDDPARHARWFAGSDDVSAFVLAGAGHIPQVSPRRADLWAHIATWIADRTGAPAEGGHTHE